MIRFMAEKIYSCLNIPNSWFREADKDIRIIILVPLILMLAHSVHLILPYLLDNPLFFIIIILEATVVLFFIFNLIFLRQINISIKNSRFFVFGAIVTFSFLWQFDFFIWLSNSGSAFWCWINAHNVSTNEARAAISRNHGGFILAFIGIILVAWGRVIAHKSNVQEKEKNIHERYEKAAAMLSNDMMSVRIAGCRALRALAKDDKSMWSPCAGLLFSYIQSPYLSGEERSELCTMLNLNINEEHKRKYEHDSSNLIKLFDKEKVLRTDIQEAINSISDIYRYVHDKAGMLDDIIIQLPSYFWQNTQKGSVHLGGANLKGQDMQDANLISANLENAELQYAILSGVDFTKANLSGAKLQGADLSGAKLRDAILKGADLMETDLLRANLSDAKLQGTDLSGANLKDVNLKGANLMGVDLSKANLEGVNFASANLKGISGLSEKQNIASILYGEKICMPPQKLSDFISIKKLDKYKVHCGVRNPQGVEPLNVFVDGEWDRWQQPWGNRFNRNYIFTMMRFYPAADKNIWLFGGIYEIEDRQQDKQGIEKYNAKLTKISEEYIGKLKIKFDMGGRYPYRNLEGIYEEMEVVGILDKRYGEQ